MYTIFFKNRIFYFKPYLWKTEEIEVLIIDDLTVQVNNFYSNAIGGVKLQVKKIDYEKAFKILINTGYIKEQNSIPNKFLTRLDDLTSKLPIIGKSSLELRLLTLVAIALIIIIIPIVLLCYKELLIN